MDLQAKYRKTEKGVQAIGSRSAGVAGKLRMLLILVDGKKNVDELKRLAVGAMIGEADQLLAQLVDEGLIELESAGTPAPAPAPAPASAAAADLGPAKALAIRRLIELLGPSADHLCIKIEEAKDGPQFIEVMKRAYATVRDIKGQSVAEGFGQSVEAQMPPA